MGKTNDGIRRVMTDELMSDVSTLPAQATAVSSPHVFGVPAPCGIFRYEDRSMFPCVVRELIKLPEGKSDNDTKTQV